MTIKQTAITLVRATEIFKDFFKCDICYAMQNMEMRSEQAD